MNDYLKTVAHSENSFRKEQGWEDKFVVMHSGNHSLVHPLDTILDAADALRDDPRFVFAFIGGGRGKEIVDARLREQSNGASNIISLPYQSLDQIRYSLSAADLHIVTLGNKMSGIVHPCKIYGVLSIGRPLLTLGPKESYLSDITGENEVGWSIRQGDDNSAVAALKKAVDQTKKEREAMGLRAQQIAIKKFSREKILNKFLHSIHCESLHEQ